MAFLRLNSFGTVRHHQDVDLLSFTDRCLSLLPFHRQFQGTKNPASVAVSRVREKFVFRSSEPAYTEIIQITFGPLPARREG